MQFYLDGFRTGNPLIAPESRKHEDSDVVDVLVIGNGPAGSLIAAQLAEFPSISTRFIERRETPMTHGQADGLSCRTVEMFNAFGMAEALNRESYRVSETVFWGPDGNGGLTQTGRVADTEPGLSEFAHVTVNQARLQAMLVERMAKSPTRLQPEFGLEVTGVEIPDDPNAPVEVSVRQLNLPPAAPDLIIRARYVIGADGARSVVRRSLGLNLKGDAQNHAWGVMDVLAETNFPDYRHKAIIRSESGGVSIIPREGGYMIRLYTDLGELDPGDQSLRGKVSPEYIVNIAQQVFAPFSFVPKEIPWWSMYEVAQRLTDRFDNVSDEQRGAVIPRVFIAGDACHTHSARAGQGMNVSMQDAFNLGWKLAAVLEGRSPASLLDTYNEERRPVAKQLIDFDQYFAKALTGLAEETSAADGSADLGGIQNAFLQAGRFTAGVATHYPPSLLTGDDTYQSLAIGYPVGMRFHSAPVVRVADTFHMHLGHVHEADGRWRLYAFGDAAPVTSDASRLRALCEWLAENPASPVRRFTPAGADIDAVFDVRAILQQPHNSFNTEDLPALLRPVKGPLGLKDYEKAFAPAPGAVAAPAGVQDIFDMRGIDRTAGALVVVRPDQYVAQVLPLDAHDELAAFFARFMLPQN